MEALSFRTEIIQQNQHHGQRLGDGAAEDQPSLFPQATVGGEPWKNTLGAGKNLLQKYNPLNQQLNV